MSLRGSETTEAISQHAGNAEIATLPSVARNDKEGITTQSLRERRRACPVLDAGVGSSKSSSKGIGGLVS